MGFHASEGERKHGAAGSGLVMYIGGCHGLVAMLERSEVDTFFNAQ